MANRPNPAETPTAVAKADSGVKCMVCGKFVKDEFVRHATAHKDAIRERIKSTGKTEQTQILFLEYKDGIVVGRKIL